MPSHILHHHPTCKKKKIELVDSFLFSIFNVFFRTKTWVLIGLFIYLFLLGYFVF